MDRSGSRGGPTVITLERDDADSVVVPSLTDASRPSLRQPSVLLP
jgi:hypothetical protein